MAIIEWTDRYKTGVPDIDREHRELFSLINDLHDRVQSGSAETAIIATIDALIEYVHYHFAREEALLETCHYPEIENHIQRHRKLQTQIETYRKFYVEEPGNFQIDDFMGFLANWLEGHILETDMAYVPSVRTFVDTVFDPPG